MGKISLRHKVYIYDIFFAVILLLISCICLVSSLRIKKTNYSLMKIDFSSLVNDIENGMEVSEYQYAILDETGIVKYSSLDRYEINNNINLHSLAINKTGIYSSPILHDDIVIGYIICELDVSDYQSIDYTFFILTIIFTIIGIILIYRLNRILAKDVFNPILDIHTETKEITSGNYNYELKYDYITEVGSLSHDIEALRDELRNSNLREQKLKENEKLLLACISHDLKTPVATISGYAEGIRDGVCKTKDKLNHYCDTIINKTIVLTKLIDDILEHSNLELNEFSINKIDLLSKPFFDESLDELRPDIEASHLELIVENEAPNMVINIDPKRIKQVLQNIISNSIKYTDNGSITISYRMIRNDIVISIKDTGKGIEATDIPFVFDKFFRGEKARSLNIPGSGLGLNICRYIIEHHGGKIECDSILNVGTTISFSLPIN